MEKKNEMTDNQNEDTDSLTPEICLQWADEFSNMETLCDKFIDERNKAILRSKQFEEENTKLKLQLTTLKSEELSKMKKENESLRKDINELKQKEEVLTSCLKKMAAGYKNISKKFHLTSGASPSGASQEKTPSDGQTITCNIAGGGNSGQCKSQAVENKQNNHNPTTTKAAAALNTPGGHSPNPNGAGRHNPTPPPSTCPRPLMQNKEKLQSERPKSPSENVKVKNDDIKSTNAVQNKPSSSHGSQRKREGSLSPKENSGAGTANFDSIAEDVLRMERYSGVAAKRKLANEISHSESKKIKTIEPIMSPDPHLVIDEDVDEELSRKSQEPSQSIFTQRRIAGTTGNGTSSARERQGEKSPECPSVRPRPSNKKDPRLNRSSVSPEPGEIVDSPRDGRGGNSSSVYKPKSKK